MFTCTHIHEPTAVMPTPDLPSQPHDENPSDRRDPRRDTVVKSDPSTSGPGEPDNDDLLSSRMLVGIPREDEGSALLDDEWEALLDEYEQGFEMKTLHNPGMPR